MVQYSFDIIKYLKPGVVDDLMSQDKLRFEFDRFKQKSICWADLDNC